MSRTQTTAKNVKTVIMVLYVSRASILMLSLLPAMVTSYCIATAVEYILFAGATSQSSYPVYVLACVVAEVASVGFRYRIATNAGVGSSAMMASGAYLGSLM